ncbi:MAG: carboxypeptidase-like regulatory domain-containing protein [Bacteroides sp.]|nr:carboxypeptidase-like regulatory domain-containing protein [Bacteroides sp.]
MTKIRFAIFCILTITYWCYFPGSGYSMGNSVSSTKTYTKKSGNLRNVIGVVRDETTHEALPFVNVFSKQNKKGVTTDQEGVFKLYLPVGAQIDVTSLGYDKKSVKFNGERDTISIYLTPSSTALEEVIIKPKKQKYSKKNNPAVELMQRVRKDKDIHNPINSPAYSFDKYDKVVIALNDYKGYLPGEDGKVKGKIKVISELVDTATWTGKRILDVSLKESVSSHIYTSDGVDKEIVTAQRSNGIDKAFDEAYTRVLFEDLLRDVNVYDNDVPVMRNRFVSPLSTIGADFYKYHITDTVLIGDERCVELTYAPHNPESMGFNGRLYIPVEDSVKYVKRVTMRLPKAANVNYVENMILNQTFRKDSIGKVHKIMDDIVVELHIAGSLGRVYLSRQSRLDNQSYERRDDLKDYYTKLGSRFVIDEAEDRPDEFWSESRMIPLTYAESKLGGKDSPFKKSPVIYWTMRAIEIVIKGYVTTGKNSKFDFGPIDTFVSYNATEGLRFAVGGLTTANLNDHIFGRGYVAYGIKDHRWKYNAELEYSFNKKKYHSREFPMNGIRATYRYDVNKLGQHYMTNSASNLLNSVKRLESNLTTYERVAKLEYNIEWMNHLSFSAELSSQRQESSKHVSFIDGYGNNIDHYNQNNLRLQVRWAPNEKFMQTYNERRAVNRDAICLIFTQTFGPKKLFGSEFTMNLSEFCLQKRFWFSAFGYADVVFKAAKLWNQVQFPALLWQNANVAYTVQTETFSLLNPMEFALDQYVSLDLNYNLNGLLFNRLPLIKKLGLREVISFKGFYGGLTRKNNPEYNDNLFRFPDASTQIMGKTPYMELGVGIDNILTFLRLDYIWRLSYRNKPGVPDSGLRFSFHFAF